MVIPQEQLAFSAIAPVAPLVVASPVLDEPYKLGRASVEYHDAHAILAKASGVMSEYDFTLNLSNGCRFGCTCYAILFSTTPKRTRLPGRLSKSCQRIDSLLKQRIKARMTPELNDLS